MSAHKFFYLTIQGDDLDLAEVQRTITLPCRIYRKGEIIEKKRDSKVVYRHTPQKTNRWLYIAEDNSEISSESFILNQLDLLLEHILELQNYISSGMAMLEVVLYAQDATDLELTLDHITRLNQLGLGISISFC